jgi:hypothetical protein
MTDQRIAEFTDIQVKMLQKMLDWDNDYYYPYDWFDDLYPKKILKKEMRGLIARGWVLFHRGGIDDEGRICGGSGFSLRSERIEELRLALDQMKEEK